MLNGALMIAAAAAATALTAFVLWRRAEARGTDLSESLERLEGERSRLAADLSKQEKARKRQADELAGYRKKAEKTKKRQSKGAEQPLGTASRVRDLEQSLERAELAQRGLEAERQALADRVDTLEARLEVSTRQLEEARAPAPAPVEPPDEASALERLRSDLAAHREQASKLEEALEQARSTEARMRKRMSNQEQLYASLRAELDVKKDRLRTQEEQLQRLQALKVAVGGTTD